MSAIKYKYKLFDDSYLFVCLSLSRSHSSMASASRAITATLDKYHKDRLSFVQSIADYASRDSNIDSLVQTAGVMELLRPLLSDPQSAVQQASAIAIGRCVSMMFWC